MELSIYEFFEFAIVIIEFLHYFCAYITTSKSYFVLRNTTTELYVTYDFFFQILNAWKI